MQDSEPLVSVLVPCRNEKETIEVCVESLLHQDPVSGGFEIIVADGMSDDGTREILKHLEEANPQLRVVDNPRRTTASGMNAGILKAQGAIIAIMGAHNNYAPDYLRKAVDVLQETGADNVGGSMLCQGGSWLQCAIAAAHHSAFSAGGARWHDPTYEGEVDTVFGGVYRREVFDRIGLFDEELIRNQDDELNLRLTRAGGRIWQSPSIRSWYHPRKSLPGLFCQYMQYGYWKVKVFQKHRGTSSPRHFVPPAFVLSLMILALGSLFDRSAVELLVALLATYSLCLLISSIITASRTRWLLLCSLPLVFATYHVAYGYGFLRGIWDFLLLKRRPGSAFTRLSRTAG